MNRVLLLLVVIFVACSGDTSFVYAPEHERQEMFPYWATACAASGRVVFTHNPIRNCSARHSCIPHRADWKWIYYKDAKKAALHPHGAPAPTNNTVCVSTSDVFRGLQ